MKRAMLILGAIWISILLSGPAAAGIIAGPSCDPSYVTATSYGGADACIGLLDKSNPGPGPNDSESFLNTAQSFDDSTVIWDANGAFGFNDWDFLGKDDQEGGQTFIDVTSGNPAATWSVDSALNGSFVIAAKQANLLGLWYFESLAGVTGGLLYINEIFGSGYTDDGWSHVSIYGRETSVPEPAPLVLLGMGLVGIGFARRFRTRNNK